MNADTRVQAVWMTWMAANTEPIALDKHTLRHCLTFLDAALAEDPAATDDELMALLPKSARPFLNPTHRATLLAALRTYHAAPE